MLHTLIAGVFLLFLAFMLYAMLTAADPDQPYRHP